MPPAVLLYADKAAIFDLNIGGTHQLLTTPEPVLPGRRELTFVMQRKPKDNSVVGRASLWVDGIEVWLHADQYFNNDFWSGLDIGFDHWHHRGRLRAFAFTGKLRKVTVDLGADKVDHDGVGRAEMARE